MLLTRFIPLAALCAMLSTGPAAAQSAPLVPVFQYTPAPTEDSLWYYEIGGWQDISMVRKYAHLAPETLAQYAEAACRPRLVQGTNLAHPPKSAGQDIT